MDHTTFPTAPLSRRAFATVAALAAAAPGLPAVARTAADPAYQIRNRGIRHSVMGWCFNPMQAPVLARHAREIGLVGIEGIDRMHYPEVRRLGLDISLVGSHGFAKGPCNPAFRDEVVAKLDEAIDVAADVGSRKVITFTRRATPAAANSTTLRRSTIRP
jgi:hydroxypyruvate isomerase